MAIQIMCIARFELNAAIPLDKTIGLLKGEGSHWANARSLIKPKLAWADEYFAVSVSESMVDKVRAYIANQEEHHKKITWNEEYEMSMKKYGLRKDRQHKP